MDDLPSIRQRHQKQKLVMTSGTFDLLHAGHLSYLTTVKKYGDVVLVLLSGDARVKARKGNKRPVISETDRANLLDGLKIVDYVLIDPSKLTPEETDPIHREILERLQPDYYVTDGADPRFYHLMPPTQFIITERSDVETSTSAIIERILNLYDKSRLL